MTCAWRKAGARKPAPSAGSPSRHDPRTARRIKSVRVRLRGVGKQAGLGGRLALVGHRTYLESGKSEGRSILNVFGRQGITLSGADTDTDRVIRKDGRFGSFERCGVSSTWMLSIPAAVEAIEDGRQQSRHREALEKLEDVILDIRYTAKT